MGEPGKPIKVSNKECDYTARSVTEENIDQYTCVFKQSYERAGFLNSDIKGENRPEHWSMTCMHCTGFSKKHDNYNTPGTDEMSKIQESCVGHKLKTGDLRNQEF